MTEPPPDSSRPRPTTSRPIRLWVTLGLGCAALVGAATFYGQSGDIEKEAMAAKPPSALPVRTASVTREKVALTSEQRGELVTETAELAAETTGRLVEVKVHIGDTFEKGDVLAVVDATLTRRELAEAQAQVRTAEAEKARAEAELEAARLEVERGVRLAQDRLVSEQELQNLRSKQSVLAAGVASAAAQRAQAAARVQSLSGVVGDARLKAPFAGAVAERYLDAGSLVQPGTSVLRLVQSGALRVRFRVPERDFAWVAEGMPLKLTTQATGEDVLRGRLIRVSAEVSRTDRTMAVEGLLDDTEARLRPGMYARVLLVRSEIDDALVIPPEALLSGETGDDGPQHVFVVADGVAQQVEVEHIGDATGRAVVKGVEVGQQVVVQGHQGLRDGAKVRVISSTGATP